MTDLVKHTQPSDPTILRYWQRIPVLIRAIALGLLVSTIGVFAWPVIVVIIPAPWSLVVMGGVLWLYWKYFSGSWWPKATAEARSVNFRATRPSAAVWKWGLMAAMLAVVVLESGFVITFRIVEFPAEAWNLGYDFSAVPLWLAWLVVIMSAMVAGVCEEVGFRGYMQVPLEKRYGPGVAITIVSTVFLVSHLRQAWAPPVLFHLFAISALWGILAYASGSLIPGMISHTVADIFNFSYWWTDVAGTFDKLPITETGIDSHFVVWVLIFVASVAAFSWAARKTLAARRHT
ncbi:MAG: type II CAAX endopeptidase family protein [Anaerolineae bacterium]